MRNTLQTVLSQYGNSPRMLALIDGMNAAIDPSVDIDAFYAQIMDINTATGYGLDVWGRIVNVSRFVNLSASHAFGFATGFYPFGEAPFFGGLSSTNNYPLSDDAYRKLIFVKALTNISNCAIPTLNRIINFLFPGRGRCYVRDDGNMAMTYVFEFLLTDVETAILFQSGVILHPTGVQVNFEITPHYFAPGYIDPAYIF